VCGIAGFLTDAPSSAEQCDADLRRMARAIAHRGPDDQGFWHELAAGIALCHRRLSIIDLSPSGAQPMRSASGRFVIVFNGEIYNYRELRRELEAGGSQFRGASDTEVLLAAFEQWGIDAAIRRTRGMFAIALWDGQDRALYLARDRFGEKPLYYGRMGNTFLFGSELKALRAHHAWRSEIDRDSVVSLLRYFYIPGARSINKNIVKVRPGCILRVSRSATTFSVDERVYWAPRALPPADAPRTCTDAEAVERVEQSLNEAVRLQMVADVPVGAFLSGGIDSSLVVALMQKASSRPVRTFSIGFREEDYNEAPFAREIARHLGTDHTELTVTPADALRVIPRLADIYDEPFADWSQIPTFIVSELARRAVTVSLSGDGGDELFGGYSHYPATLEHWQRVERVPAAVRAAMRGLLSRLPLSSIDLLLAPLLAAGPWRRQRHLADKIKESAAYRLAGSFPDLYRELLSAWHWPEEVVIGGHEVETVHTRASARPGNIDAVSYMMYMDACQYLPDDILVKVDRAAMAVSLETRVPLLDHEVAEAAWSVPATTHRKHGAGKWILRQLLARHVPRKLFERPKGGFGAPVERWLRQDLRDWADDLLGGPRLRSQGIFEPRVVMRRWQQHRDGAANWCLQLWPVLMFQAWHDRWESDTASAVARPFELVTVSESDAASLAPNTTTTG
jgi:asparagine synthase (glutamine-hydrolysing)